MVKVIREVDIEWITVSSRIKITLFELLIQNCCLKNIGGLVPQLSLRLTTSDIQNICTNYILF